MNNPITGEEGVEGGGCEPAAPQDARPSKRLVPEWIGKTPDTPIPKHVKLRIWDRCGGRCWITGKKILIGDAYDFDHKIALCNGGENREFNIAPALRVKHREKTRDDLAERVKTERTRAKHLGLWSTGSRKIQSRGFR